MKKSLVYLLTLLVASSLTLIIAPTALTQPENVQILSYSLYIDSLGYLVVVGEIQNTGPNVLSTVIITGAVSSSDDVEVTSAARVWGANFLHSQRAPFYMEFYSQSTSDGTWFGVDITDVSLDVYQAEPTMQYQYPELRVVDHKGGVTSDGVFWVNGNVENTGSLTAKNATVVGIFYNSEGKVVAVGYTNTLSPASINPSASAAFKVGAFDRNQTEVPTNQKIVSYSLLIQVLEPLLQGAAPVLSETPTPPPITIESPSTADNDQTFIYITIVAVAAIAVTVIMVIIKKHPSKPVVVNDKPVKRTKSSRRYR